MKHFVKMCRKEGKFIRFQSNRVMPTILSVNHVKTEAQPVIVTNQRSNCVDEVTQVGRDSENQSGVTVPKWPVGLVVGLFWVLGLVLLTGCIQRKPNEVIVYSALDREFSEPILNDVEAELDLTIRAKFDLESNKTVGLVTSIIQHQKNPQADLFWNNEILHTLRLQKLGLLEAYRSPESKHFPDAFVSPSHHWNGFAARARVLIINTDLIPSVADRPSSVFDLADPKWKGRCAMARPLFGTSATHAAVLFVELGDERAKELLTEIATNAVIEGGNKQVAQKVARGQYAFGITDTDDAIIELENAEPVAIVFPDQGDDAMGVLLIPNALALIKNGPNPQRAKRLIDRLLSADVEQRLAEGASSQIPLRTDVDITARVQPVDPDEPLKIMKPDFEAAADLWDEAATFLVEAFPTGVGAR